MRRQKDNHVTGRKTGSRWETKNTWHHAAVLVEEVYVYFDAIVNRGRAGEGRKCSILLAIEKKTKACIAAGRGEKEPACFMTPKLRYDY